jgi:putative ABC transport system permease protein
MVMVLGRKVKRTILENKSAYFGSAALIIVSCLLFTMLNLLTADMARATAAFEKDYTQEDANFTTSKPIADIRALEGRLGAVVEECASFDYALLEGRTLRIFRQNAKVDIPAIIAGGPLKTGGILLDPAFAKANGFKTGDAVQVLGNTFRVDGTVSLPNYIYPLKSENDLIGDPNAFGIAVMTREDFAATGRGTVFYAVRFNAEGDRQKAAEGFLAALEKEGNTVTQWTDIADNKRVTYVSTKIEGIGQISSTLPVAILLLTCILTGIVVWRMLNREAAVIGTLYALGYRKKELMRHYMMYPLVTAAAGGVIGTLLGALCVMPMLGLMVEYFNIPIPSVNIDPGYIALSLLLPVLFLMISGYAVLHKVLRFSPVALMKGTAGKGKVGALERRLKLERMKFRTKFAIREQMRSLSRLAFLLLGVALASMLLLLGFTAQSSLDYLLNKGIQETFKFRHEYVYNTLHEEKPPEGAEIFAAAQFRPKQDAESDFTVCGIEPGSRYISLKNAAGAEMDKNSIIMTRPLASKLGIDTGDEVEVVNKINRKTYALTVEGIAETYIGEYIFMPVTKFNEMMGLPAGSYSGLWSGAALDIPEDRLYRAQSMEESRKAFAQSTETLQATIGVIAVMAFAIGLIVIYVVTSLIIEENRGNISLMKVMGYRKKEVNGLVLNSSVFVVIAGYILGIPLILASMSALFQSLAKSVKVSLPVSISLPYILIGFAVVYLTYWLSRALSRKKVDRISMAEALKAGTE